MTALEWLLLAVFLFLVAFAQVPLTPLSIGALAALFFALRVARGEKL